MYVGKKALVSLFKEYVVVISPPSIEPKGLRNLLPNILSSRPDATEQSTITLLDLENKFIVHTSQIPSAIRETFTTTTHLYLLTSPDSILHELYEKDMSQKLELLYARNLHQLAIQFAQKAHLPQSQINEIIQKYADYLFSRGEYDAALDQYLLSLETGNPSEIIRKYLDVQRIGNLVSILEQLHALRLAGRDHTTLLLNCYARLKNVEQLERFIKGGQDGVQPSGGEFDVDTAIAVCRQGRYYEQAGYLAEKFGEHDLFISILVENLKQYSRALSYIKQLPPSEVSPPHTKTASSPAFCFFFPWCLLDMGTDGCRLGRIYMRMERHF
jgi:vacuolar protein sorting-associated protein 11